MKSIRVKTYGNFNNIENYIMKHSKSAFTEEEIIDIAEQGLLLFQKNTPVSSGKTANSWSYEILESKKEHNIIYHNSNIQNGLNIAVLIDSGHVSSSGRWVSGRNYINQTIRDLCLYIKKM